jgi:hypothetical protein
LKEPVRYEVEALPHKIKFEINTSSNQGSHLKSNKQSRENQALVGDPIQVVFGIEQEPDILLKSLKVSVIDIESTMTNDQFGGR